MKFTDVVGLIIIAQLNGIFTSSCQPCRCHDDIDRNIYDQEPGDIRLITIIIVISSIIILISLCC